MFPKVGTLESILLEAMLSKPQGEGVSYLDFVGTGITEDNIDQIVNNLRHGMYESEDDSSLKQDA